jgi:hypothetical protein
VEAPGVECRPELSGFDGLREALRGEGLHSVGLAGGGEIASEVSGGFAEVRCSGVVAAERKADFSSGVGGPSERGVCADAGGGGTPAVGCEVQHARLLALEHVLQALEALLEVGEVVQALNLVRGCRRPG